jgi:ketosteroid isomerase-like protein
VTRSGETCISARTRHTLQRIQATIPTAACYNNPMPEDHEAAIRQARAHSNRSIARRNLLGVGQSLAEDFVAIIGDGTFVSSRAAYLKLFKQGFDAPRTALTYERIPDTITVATPPTQAAELGHWIATTATGTYAAMWRHTPAGWQLRSELYITLVVHEI